MSDLSDEAAELVARAYDPKLWAQIDADIGGGPFQNAARLTRDDAMARARAAIAAMPRQAPATDADAREILAALLHEAGDISGAIHVREGSCRQINSRVALAAMRAALTKPKD